MYVLVLLFSTLFSGVWNIKSDSSDDVSHSDGGCSTIDVLTSDLSGTCCLDKNSMEADDWNELKNKLSYTESHEIETLENKPHFIRHDEKQHKQTSRNKRLVYENHLNRKKTVELKLFQEPRGDNRFAIIGEEEYISPEFPLRIELVRRRRNSEKEIVTSDNYNVPVL